MQEFLNIIKQAGVEYIQFCFQDYNGISRAKVIHSSALYNALAYGINFSTAIMSFNSLEQLINGHRYGSADGDFWAKPDLNTYVTLPYLSNTGSLLCNLVDKEGKPWTGCPRTLLQEVITKVEQYLNAKVWAAFEPEIMLFSKYGHDGPIVLIEERLFAPHDADLARCFLHDLVENLNLMKIEVEQISGEAAPAQHEINLKYQPLLKACDDLVYFRLALKALSRKHGIVATMMPKPLEKNPGNGLHLHFSFTDQVGKNLLTEDTDKYGLGLSKLAYAFIGGLLKHGPALIALGAPTVNSYKRFVPGVWAPTHISYGPANRSVLIRIPENRHSQHLEFRGADGCCNPYLFAAGILVAGLDGIMHSSDPGEPVREDMQLASQLHSTSIERIPLNLGEALEKLKADQVIRQALRPEIIDEYYALRFSEWSAYLQHVSQWEQQAYLNIY